MAPLSKFTPQITPSPTTPSESETTANIPTQQHALTKERIIAAGHGGLTLGTKTISHKESHNWPSNNHGDSRFFVGQNMAVCYLAKVVHQKYAKKKIQRGQRRKTKNFICFHSFSPT